MRVKQFKARNVQLKKTFSPHTETDAGELILDDLSFDILEALKNVDEVTGDTDQQAKKNSTQLFLHKL